MKHHRFTNPIFVALDTPDLYRAVELAKGLKPHVGGLKVGLEFITANGPDGVCAIVELGLPVFADVKFHDIPNTVAGAARAIASTGAAMFNIHVSGSVAMIRAAIEAAAESEARPRVLGVTVLTSMEESDLEMVGQNGDMREQVLRLARLAKSTGLDGVVCSPHEIAAIREACGPDCLIVTPGIRPVGSHRGDQRRLTTPLEAMHAGADILVIGRPITAASDPAAAARTIAAEILAPDAV
ncbi:MAG TPA: orotidine-5'-phosphate decarboxylase [Rhizomicrobium sp.]